MLKRSLEIITGLIVGLATITNYGDQMHPVKPLTGFITSNPFLQVAITFGMLIAAFRLVGGKGKKDYSPFFFNLFVKIYNLKNKAGRLAAKTAFAKADK